ncbi:response regulator [Flavobacterium humi]|uniref:Response regulator n=1 Tax=Flavobacterium humi TaxID=2562683 RepID=A0A4Z0L9P0_9FLAO|nr:response regulator [Flavobacterium humi]TGD57899.1 response regulator [Flavobacterium humi]
MITQDQNFQRNIYLVDDDEDDRAMFADALTEVDGTVVLTQAENGKQLMDMLQVQPNPMPEVVLLDINMPMKNGFECLEEIRTHEGDLKELKVIMFSTCDNPESIKKALALGATFYAVKPNSFHGLKSFIQEVLQIDWFSPQLNHMEFRII